MCDEDTEPLGAEPGDVVGIGDLVVPAIDPGRAVAPVDGERTAEEAERAAAEVEARPFAIRLRAISDDIDIESGPANALDILADGYTADADLLIDATINVTVAARLDEWRRAATSAPQIAQVATDPRTATLGLLIVAASDISVGPATIDDATWTAIRDDPALERFHGFWTTPTKADQLVPALGCSTPTFHGSSADLACLAGSLVSLLAAQLASTTSGAHLIESSHARGPAGGGHHFIAFR